MYSTILCVLLVVKVMGLCLDYFQSTPTSPVVEVHIEPHCQLLTQLRVWYLQAGSGLAGCLISALWKLCVSPQAQVAELCEVSSPKVDVSVNWLLSLSIFNSKKDAIKVEIP